MSSLPRHTASMQAATRGSNSGLVPRQAYKVSSSFIKPSHQGTSSFSSSSTSSLPEVPFLEKGPGFLPGTSLTWDRYLYLRKQKARAGVIASFPTTIGALGVSASYFLTQEVDPASTIMGIDPVMMSIGEVIICGALGWLIGPAIGSQLYSFTHNKHRKEFEVKDRRFYEHLLRKRCDPSRQNMQNRPIDYYGEKIGSLRDYRQWLRDQAAYSRKAAHGVEDDLKTL